jgi:ubiquinone/menaquinone biosynthesis C-methylase UbiE
VTDEDYYAQSKRVYAVFAPWYDVLVRPLRALRREVVLAISVTERDRVLDVATGTGEQALAFAAAGADVVGVDLSEAMLAIARRKRHAGRVLFQQADATALPFEASSFDVVSISFALHEMPTSVRAAALAEMARVARPQARLVVVDYRLPTRRVWRGAVFRVVSLYEGQLFVDFVRSDLRAELSGAGFDVIDERAAILGTVRIVRGTRRA